MVRNMRRGHLMIDVSYFGQGAGVVLLGWVVGTVVAGVFSIFRRVL
jgi:hypothetical protein